MHTGIGGADEVTPSIRYGVTPVCSKRLWCSFPAGLLSPLRSFAFENEDVRLNSVCRLNGHGQSLSVW